MKQVLFLFASSAVVLMGADLAGVHTVYLLPMGSSLDQYLAERLTSEHVFQVVTDPKRADAVFTDRIGTAFEERLADLLAPPPAEKPATAAPAAPAAGAGQANNATGNQTPRSGLDVFAEEPANKLSNPASYSSFGRGKGTIFLVDVKSKQVIWSIYERPKSSESSQLDRSASDIVNRLRRDLKNPEGAKP
jgi:hypothetical protein